MFAPVQDLGLVAIWDDGDSSHSETTRRSHTHARCWSCARRTSGAGSCSAARAARWRPPSSSRPAGRGRWSRTGSRCGPPRRWCARSATASSRATRRPGPPGCQSRLAGRAGRAAERVRCWCRCPGGATYPGWPVSGAGRPRGAGTAPGRWRPRTSGTCGAAGAARDATGWHCAECGGTRLRAQVVGARRTAEELGRAFPAVPVRTSGRDHVLDSVPERPALVVSTPGAEPVAEGGYAAALLLDGWAMLGRPDLRAGEEALRRWIGRGVAGARPGGGRHGRGRRRADAAAGAGPGALGPRRPCPAGAGRAGRAGLSAGVADGVA